MNQDSNRFLIFNALSFYIYWWICFIGSSKEQYYYGPALGILYMLIHFFIIKDKYREFKYIFICMITGFIIETLMLKLNFISYRGILSDKFNIAPLWIVILWMGFGTTVYHSFKWIVGKYKLSFFLGAIFTPIFYISADKIGSISFNYSILISYLILSLIWGISLLLLIYIAEKIN
jgi:hypothetical protein